MLAVLLPWILPDYVGMSIEHYHYLSGRCSEGLVYLGMLVTACLCILAVLISHLFSPSLGFDYYSLWLSFSCFIGPQLVE